MKLKKIIPLILLVALSSESVFAAGTKKAILNTAKIEENVQTEIESRDVLTVEEAVDRAIEYSTALKNNSDNTALSEESLDDAMRDIKAVSEGYEVMNYAIQIKELNQKIKNYKINSEIEKESIILSVTEYFADIIKGENQLKLYDENIDLTERELEISKAKLQLGRLSETEYNSLKTEYDNLIIDRAAKETEIDTAYSSLNQLIGCRDLTKKYNIELSDIEYEPLGNVDFETDKTRVKESSQKVVEAKEDVEIEKYKLNAYTSLASTSASSKESQKISYANAQRTLEDTKTEQEVSFTNLYNNILTAESEYEKNLKELESLQSDLKLTLAKVEMGRATELEADKIQYEINSLNADIENSIYEHYILVEKYNNPDLM